MTTQLHFIEPDSKIEVRFAGSTYQPVQDDIRLTGQLARIVKCVQDGAWRTLAEIETATGAPQASISAQLRHLRKPRFGAHTVEKQPRGDRATGLFEYRVILNPATAQKLQIALE